MAPLDPETPPPTGVVSGPECGGRVVGGGGLRGFGRLAAAGEHEHSGAGERGAAESQQVGTTVHGFLPGPVVRHSDVSEAGDRFPQDSRASQAWSG